MLSGKVIVKLGMRWRIGSGQRVSVWKDPWLRDEVDPCVKSPIVTGMEHLCVRDLFNEEKNGWNTPLLHHLFQPFDVNRILKVPILDPEGEDEVFWWRSRNGHYSVRSAYFGAMEDLIDNTHLRVPGAWMNIWRIKIPQKVKLFLWRVARGCLPTRINLIKRHVPCEELCPMCGEDSEDERHVFFTCSQVQEIWQQTGIASFVASVIQQTDIFSAALFQLLELLPAPKKLTFAMMFWAIWKRRNDKLWEGLSKPVSVSVQMALDTLQQWQQARVSVAFSTDSAAAISDRSHHSERWLKPAAGSLKCNVDAAIFKGENKYGIGICVRDDLGVFKGAKSMWFYGSPTPQEAESMGLLQALQFIQAKNFTSVVIEMDCQSVVNGVNNGLSLNNEVGAILSRCRSILSQNQSYRISYIRRQANLVAHSLARASKLYASSHTHEFSPTCITNIIYNEMI